MVRFAQISDLHFGVTTCAPSQFLSKRWIGNINYFFNRRWVFDHARLFELIPLLQKEEIRYLFISGDLTVTSRREEFQKARDLICYAEAHGIEVFAIPGNHDHYTKEAGKTKPFYDFFHSQYQTNFSYNLKRDRLTATRLIEGMWVIPLDTAYPVPFFSCQGFFSIEMRNCLESVLKQIPSSEPILIMNHYPFFSQEARSKELVGAPMLRSLIEKHPNILFYLYGHTHRQVVANLRPNALPILSNSGATPHRSHGSCHLFALEKASVKLDVYRYSARWNLAETYRFAL